MWKDVGPKLAWTIIKMDIPMEDLPFVDGRLDTVRLLTLYLKAKYQEDAFEAMSNHDR